MQTELETIRRNRWLFVTNEQGFRGLDRHIEWLWKNRQHKIIMLYYHHKVSTTHTCNCSTTIDRNFKWQLEENISFAGILIIQEWTKIE